MVGQEILVLFIMVRIRALQPKIQPPLAGGLIFGLRTDRSEPVRAHDQYADEQLVTAQKRIFLIEFLPSGWLLFIKVSCAFQRAKIQDFGKFESNFYKNYVVIYTFELLITR